MKSFAIFILTVIVPLIIITVVIRDASRENIRLEELRQEYAVKHIPSVDHSKHEALQVSFENPHEITAACLSCHTERGEEVLGNAHWNWEREAYIEGRGLTYLGKKNLINNFCTGIVSNEGTCNRCHIGFGWKDEHFDFGNPYNIDCLVCHDNSGLYEKAPGAAGYPVQDLDFTTIVQSVGQPRKNNCGYCHFHGGGGNNVKHGDLEVALLTASREVDVHMSADGADLSCIDCHKTTNHQMLGRYYGVSSSNTQRVNCEQCHTGFPHMNHKLNEHTVKVGCQTCHIPIYAKVNPTKMFWDWSTATRRRDGKPYEIIDTLGLQLYTSEKGDFNWKWNAEPDYLWFNGTADHLLLTDIIDPESGPLKINTLFGEYKDPDSRIYPVKIHRGKQPYDTEYFTIIQAKLWDEEENQGALWLDLDWDAALRSGMEHVGRPYSGHYDFIETEMFLPVNHMVSPSENALQCQDCHTRAGGRLQHVQGVYIPGQTNHAGIDFYGVMLLILSLMGVLTHAGIRWIVYKRKKTQA
jgi:octaheme c-type cytochrome (tetrathionate reductase family)